MTSQRTTIYVRKDDDRFVQGLIDKNIVSNYSQAIRLCLSMASDYFSDEQLHAEASIRLTDKRYKENKTNG